MKVKELIENQEYISITFDLKPPKDVRHSIINTIGVEDIKTILNLIQKQQEEINKKDKQIDLMAETILEDTFKLDTYWCNGCSKTGECSYEHPKHCIKYYFEKQAEEV